jgi:hypothetical protein
MMQNLDKKYSTQINLFEQSIKSEQTEGVSGLFEEIFGISIQVRY